MTDHPPRDRAPSANEPDPASWIARRVSGGAVLLIGGATAGLREALGTRGAAIETPTGDVPAEFPFPSGAFDAVVLDHVLEHSLRPERMLTEAARVLKHHGVLAVAARYGLHTDGDHADALYLRRLAGLLSDAFAIEAVDLAGEGIVVAAKPGAATADLGMLLDLAERRLAEADVRRYRAERDAETQRNRADRLDASVRTMRASRGWLMARALREGTRSPKDLARLPRLIGDAFKRKS